MRNGLVACVICLLTALSHAQADPPAEKELEALVDKLAEVTELGIGYSASLTGSQFLPQHDSDEVGTFTVGHPALVRSKVLEKIVTNGAAAIPLLLKHLDDKRKTRIAPIRGIEWMSFADEYDFNRRTRKVKPEGVNRETFGEARPENHQLTVGDLCFVALGQIVNRHFSASRYQPTGGLVVSSPTHSRRLCSVVQGDFKKLTPEEHRDLLKEDFLYPDHEDRRIGAYRRLAYYYPGEVEPLVLKQLTVPTFDVFAAEAFVRNTLYREKTAAKRRELLAKFIDEHGKASRDGILLQLFEDLDTQEADEEKRLYPAQKEKYDARAALIQLYGYQPTVKSSDIPYINTWSSADQARFLKALIHDKSRPIDETVYAIFKKIEDDDYVALGCMDRLMSRGYKTQVQQYCERRIGKSEWKEDLSEVLAKLKADTKKPRK
jgi:hypothetical protein